MDSSLAANAATNQALSAPTQNLQSTGGQTSTASPNLQDPLASSLNNGNLQLTDANGQPLNLSTSAHVDVAPAHTYYSHGSAIIFGLGGLIIIVVFAITWLISRKSN